MDIRSFTEYTHRIALLAVAVATGIALAVNQYGPGVGLSGTEVAGIAAAITAFLTVSRSIADVTAQNATAEVEAAAALAKSAPTNPVPTPAVYSSAVTPPVMPVPTTGSAPQG